MHATCSAHELQPEECTPFALSHVSYFFLYYCPCKHSVNIYTPRQATAAFWSGYRPHSCIVQSYINSHCAWPVLLMTFKDLQKTFSCSTVPCAAV